MSFLLRTLRLVGPVIIFFCVFGCVAMFFPFMGVACVARFLSAVAGHIVHLLSFPCEGEDSVVRDSLILAGLLAPP